MRNAVFHLLSFAERFCYSSIRAIALASICWCLTAAAQSTPVPPPTPPATSPVTPAQRGSTASAAPVTAPDVSREALVFDKLYTKVREEADGTGARETIARVRILADAGVKQMAVLTFTYTASTQQVDIAYVRVIKPDGSVVVTPRIQHSGFAR